jgi:hypothetical protein
MGVLVLDRGNWPDQFASLQDLLLSPEIGHAIIQVEEPDAAHRQVDAIGVMMVRPLDSSWRAWTFDINNVNAFALPNSDEAWVIDFDSRQTYGGWTANSRIFFDGMKSRATYLFKGTREQLFTELGIPTA